jgi:hypothetical protein
MVGMERIFRFLISTNSTKAASAKIGKVFPVTGRGGPLGCETSRLPYFTDNRLTDGGEDVSLTRRQTAFYPQKDTWYSFLLEAETTPGQ